MIGRLAFSVLAAVGVVHPQPVHGPVAIAARTLWLGDSITHGWQTWGSATWDSLYGPLGDGDDGFPGMTSAALAQVLPAEIQGGPWSQVVILIGTNDYLDGYQPVQTEFSAVMEAQYVRNHLPHAQVFLLQLLPADDPGSAKRVWVDQVDALLASHGALDLSAALVNPDGSFRAGVMTDVTHPAAQGYANLAWLLSLNGVDHA